MTRKEDLFHRIRSNWGEGEEFFLASKIIEFISADPGASYIPFSYFRKLAVECRLVSPQVVERVVQYLLGAESHVLELGGELINEQDEVRRLEPNELALAATQLIHPDTGERDDLLPEKIAIFFYPSQQVREILEDQN